MLWISSFLYLTQHKTTKFQKKKKKDKQNEDTPKICKVKTTQNIIQWIQTRKQRNEKYN